MSQSWWQRRSLISVKVEKQDGLKSTRGQTNRRENLSGWNEMETCKCKRDDPETVEWEHRKHQVWWQWKDKRYLVSDDISNGVVLLQQQERNRG